MECMSLLGFAACSPDAELRERLTFPCHDIERSLIPPLLRRRSSQAIQLAFSAASQVCGQTGRSPAQLPSIFASVAGEIQTTDQICSELVKADGLISPSAFHNSVQNTAAGYWSIAQQCTAPASALAAGRDTLGMALLEAWCQLACQGGELLLIAYDEAWPDYLAPGHGQPAFGVALLLAAGDHPQSLARLGKPQTQAAEFPADWASLATAMPLLAAVPLLELVAKAGKADDIALSPSSGAWSIRIDPV